MRRILLVAACALGLQGCALLGPMMDGIFGAETSIQDIQQARGARQVHLAVAGMFEAIVNELTAMLKDGTLDVRAGPRIQPIIEVGRTAIRASNAFLLQAGQQRELGRDDVADKLEADAFEQLRTANANLDLLRVVHLGAVRTAPQPFVAEPPPLLQTHPKPPEG